MIIEHHKKLVPINSNDKLDLTFISEIEMKGFTRGFDGKLKYKKHHMSVSIG